MPQVINNGGGMLEEENADYVLSFSVGEFAINTLVGLNYNFTQGFEQPLARDSVLTTVEQIQTENLSISIFPNPTSDYLYVNLEGLSLDSRIWVNLWNAVGQLQARPLKLSAIGQYAIDVSALIQGNYFLSFENAEGRIGHFQFIKINP
jgi:hypothetical protein